MEYSSYHVRRILRSFIWDIVALSERLQEMDNAEEIFKKNLIKLK